MNAGPSKWNDERRPEWQQERGPRHGCNRKMYARLKVKQRKMERAKHKHWSNDYE